MIICLRISSYLIGSHCVSVEGFSLLKMSSAQMKFVAGLFMGMARKWQKCAVHQLCMQPTKSIPRYLVTLI